MLQVCQCVSQEKRQCLKNFNSLMKSVSVCQPGVSYLEGASLYEMHCGSATGMCFSFKVVEIAKIIINCKELKSQSVGECRRF